MAWPIIFCTELLEELDGIDKLVKKVFLGHLMLLEQMGPMLGRPHVDTLKGSVYSNMKELRFSAAEGSWRVAFAFDPSRSAVMLVAGDKMGVDQNRFYRSLIKRADERFVRHLMKGKDDVQDT
ncbi:type II toxin-antitoxin system RelE/ParE family toxin [Pseudomonas sp. 148P]|uniref:Type II toxin-antitoxin system RelE/ParE family toxin n=1 Tax=Pseudomonas ulcerans TaxID=3115852 RepID=A0ABU7HRF7_9PSED|nr:MULTISPECIES: type II toxin-antitoxin system RelE/ParE family toxin [unclassified Pseudomonas]MEE1923156.1 type II toxin-antitoxin system RelE/ParE family toxin [Pseudomonas sp. 147P]MEE1934118.1 type II toxin-antitoxin system RelE/ParE family toxin [Pseudomonas sp. 148P]